MLRADTTEQAIDELLDHLYGVDSDFHFAISSRIPRGAGICHLLLLRITCLSVTCFVYWGLSARAWPQIAAGATYLEADAEYWLLFTVELGRSFRRLYGHLGRYRASNAALEILWVRFVSRFVRVVFDHAHAVK